MSEEKVCSSWVSCVMLCIALITLGPYAGTVQAEGVGSTQVIIVGSGGDDMPQNLQQAPVTKKLLLPPNKLLLAMPVSATIQAADAMGFVPSSNEFGDISATEESLSVSSTIMVQNSSYVVGENEGLITGDSSVTVVAEGTTFDLTISDIDGVYVYRGEAYSNNGRLELTGTMTDADDIETAFTYVVNDDGTIDDMNNGLFVENVDGVIQGRYYSDISGAGANGLPSPITGIEVIAIVILVAAAVLAVCLFGRWMNWFKCDASENNEFRERGSLWRRNGLNGYSEQMPMVC